jgi:hypothetical protein
MLVKRVKLDGIRRNQDCYFGASASALKIIAAAFGYSRVWSNSINFIFVQTFMVRKMELLIAHAMHFPADPFGTALHSPCSLKDGLSFMMIV